MSTACCHPSSRDPPASMFSQAQHPKQSRKIQWAKMDLQQKHDQMRIKWALHTSNGPRWIYKELSNHLLRTSLINTCVGAAINILADFDESPKSSKDMFCYLQ